MVKTDENGVEEWNYIIDHNGETDSGSYGIQTADGGYIVTGETGEYNLAAVDVLLIKLTGTNSPPYIPKYPVPESGSINNDINSDIRWTGGDPDGDTVVYDIYFGTDNNPPLIVEDYDETVYDPGILEYNTSYYWKIVAKDIYNAISEGPIWVFKTIIKDITVILNYPQAKLDVSAYITRHAPNEKGQFAQKIGGKKGAKALISDDIFFPGTFLFVHWSIKTGVTKI